MVWYRPVSYTHLDVYKRQDLNLITDISISLNEACFVMVVVYNLWGAGGGVGKGAAEKIGPKGPRVANPPLYEACQKSKDTVHCFQAMRKICCGDGNTAIIVSQCLFLIFANRIDFT